MAVWPFCARRPSGPAPRCGSKRRATADLRAAKRPCQPPNTPFSTDAKRGRPSCAAALRSCAPARRYATLRKLGEGAYGSVFEGRQEAPCRRVALKKVPLEDGKMTQESRRELECLRKLRGPHVVELLDHFTTPASVTLVLELMHTDLERVLEKGPLPAGLQQCYSAQLLAGVGFLHDRRVLHRDLKPGNLLLQGNVLKIGDFGLARVQAATMTCEVVTLWYRAPELLLGCKRYSSGVDLWACGCIMAELGSGSALFDRNNEQQMIRAIFTMLGTPKDCPGVKALQMRLPPVATRKADVPGCPAELLGVVQQLLTCDPRARLPARKALQEPFFAGVVLPAGEN